jgi:hypothetical protein
MWSVVMTAKRYPPEPIGTIQPDQIYRTTLSQQIFGYGPQATRDKIRNGELPLPHPLSSSARTEAWTGQQILDHRANMKLLAEEKAKAELAADGTKKPQLQPPQLAAAQKIKKVKLRPPAKRQRETA